MTEQRTLTRRIAARTVIAFAVALAAGGCMADDTDGTSSADCSNQVRLEGVIYTSHGHTDRNAERHSVAEAAECHDVGRNAAGSVFPEHPRQVTTWTFRGYPPAKVVGIRFDGSAFAVYVADSVPSAERERIFRELRRPTR